MNDFLKQFFRNPGTGGREADRQGQPDHVSDSEGNREPDRDDKFIKEQFTTHQKLTTNIAMSDVLRKQAEELASALNFHAAQFCRNLKDDDPKLELVVSEAGRIAEPVHWLTKQPEAKKNDAPTYFYRWKVTGRTHIFSVRASRGLIEFFTVPDKEVPHITMSEFGSRFRGSFVLANTEKGLVWTQGKNRLSADEALTFIEQFLLELARDHNKPEAGRQANLPLPASAEKQLELEKNNLLFKLLNQQEEMKGQLGRDLHDSVIADLMMLKRYLSGDKKLSNEETIEIIDEVILHLRDIVNDYSPRQLQEWGLKVGIEDLLDRMARRTGMECSFDFQGELPKLPELVSLHIFRLVQECLNNVEKHSGASSVTVSIKASPAGTSHFAISDNGKGFNLEEEHKDEGSSNSFGLEGMRERIELIRCFYPCQLNISAVEGAGTTVTMSLSLTE